MKLKELLELTNDFINLYENTNCLKVLANKKDLTDYYDWTVVGISVEFRSLDVYIEKE